MHQQFRIILSAISTPAVPGKDGPASRGGDAIDAAPMVPQVRAASTLLRLIADRGVSLRGAAGVQIETGGELWISVSDGDDEDTLRQVLDEHAKGAYRTYNVEHAHIHERTGSLAAWLGQLADKGLAVDSIMVGTPEIADGGDGDDRWAAGDIPVQATTLRVSPAPDATRAT